ncbi:YfhE family protein [Fictibacillus macauensis]|nr:YfhE family protein [Fictibacillus macauensis]
MKSKKQQATERNAGLTKAQEVIYAEEFKTANSTIDNSPSAQKSNK